MGRANVCHFLRISVSFSRPGFLPLSCLQKPQAAPWGKEGVWRNLPFPGPHPLLGVWGLALGSVETAWGARTPSLRCLQDWSRAAHTHTSTHTLSLSAPHHPQPATPTSPHNPTSQTQR